MMLINKTLVLLALSAASSASAFVVPATLATRSSPRFAVVVPADKDATEEGSAEDLFPPPLSNVGRLKRAATFWSTAIPIVANYYGKFAEMKLREGLLGETMSEDEVEVSIMVSSEA